MKLSENDKKLLTYVYHSQRESLTKISKAIGMSRIQVEYKLNKLFKEGIIENFLTLFDYGSFGYNVYVLLFIKLEKYSSLPDFSKKLEKNRNCISFGECFGKYDLYANLIFKNEGELSNFLSELIDGKEQVLDHLILKPYLAEFHPLKIFYNQKKSLLPLISENLKEKKFSENDLKILKILATDGRMKVIDLAKKTGISSEMALYKLRIFEKEKIILGCRANVRMKKLGYNYSMILLSVKNLSQQTKEKIINFARNDKRVNALVLSLFNPNCLIQIFHETEDELKESIKQIKDLLKEDLFELDVILVNEEQKINTLPFL